MQRFEYEFHDDTGNGIAPMWGAVLTVAVLAPETFTRLMVETEAYVGAVAATIRRVSFILLFRLVTFCVFAAMHSLPHDACQRSIDCKNHLITGVSRSFGWLPTATVIRKLRIVVWHRYALS